MKTISKVAFQELAENIMGEATHEYTNEVDGTLGTVWEGNGRYVYGLSHSQPIAIVIAGKGGTEVIRPCE